MGIYLVLIVLYFLPALISIERNHNNRLAIIVLNIFGGWTFIGWLISLVWACTNNITPKKKDNNYTYLY
jgi:predicted membrane channel-forming protein YqfA (hemolysin III family)